MFYVKSDDGKKVDIYGDELYTTCPICGKEFTVDIIELVKVILIFVAQVYIVVSVQKRKTVIM